MNKHTLLASDAETLLPRLLRSRVLLPKRGESEREVHSLLFLSVRERWHRCPRRRRRGSPHPTRCAPLDTPNAPAMNKHTLLASDAETLLPRLLRSRVLLPKRGESEREVHSLLFLSVRERWHRRPQRRRRGSPHPPRPGHLTRKTRASSPQPVATTSGAGSRASK